MKNNMTKRRANAKAPFAELFDRAPVQRTIFGMLYKSGVRGTDVTISRLYRAAWEGEMPFRLQQQYVGSAISVINRKIAPLRMRIKTGKTRRSYRLYRL